MRAEKDYDIVVIHDESGRWAADFRNEQQAEAVARACNSHDELVKRLAWAVSFIETYAAKAAMPATPEVNKCREALKAAGAA